MSLMDAAMLGLFQGLAEFLPISSSGHLNLLQALFGMDVSHQLLMNILLHVGTLAAVMIVFWRDWAQMILHPFRDRTLIRLFVASLPALAAKMLLGKPLEAAQTGTALLGVCFLATGILLRLTQMLSGRADEKTEVRIPEALVMGCMQAVGMLPGISRSGSTIFGGVLAGINRETAAKFSFMMSAPAIVAGLLSEGASAVQSGVGIGTDLPAMLVGMVIAGVTGYIAIRYFLRLIARVSLDGFALYMTLLGMAVMALQIAGVL